MIMVGIITIGIMEVGMGMEEETDTGTGTGTGTGTEVITEMERRWLGSWAENCLLLKVLALGRWATQTENINTAWT
jgi:hypothetical protein